MPKRKSLQDDIPRRDAYIKWFYATEGSEDEKEFNEKYRRKVKDPLMLGQPEGIDADTELYRAVFKKNIKKVKQLLEEGHDPDQYLGGPFQVYNHALHRAVQNKSMELVRLLHKESCNLDVVDGKQRTALMIAVEQENFEMVELLVDMGASGRPRDENGENVMERALWVYGPSYFYGPPLTEKRFDMLKVLMKSHPQLGRHIYLRRCHYRIDPDQSPRSTALHIACQGELWPAVHLLAKSGWCDLHREDDKERTPFQVAIEFAHSYLVGSVAEPVIKKPSWVDAIEALINAGADIEEPNETIGFPLIHCIKHARPPVVRLMILANTDIHTPREEMTYQIQYNGSVTRIPREGTPLEHAILNCREWLLHVHTLTYVHRHKWELAWPYFGIIWMLLRAGANARSLDAQFRGFIADIRKSLWKGTRRPPGLRNCKRVIVDIERRMKRPDRLDEICRNRIRSLMPGKRLNRYLWRLPLSKIAREFIELDKLPVFRTEIDYENDGNTESGSDITDEGD